MTDPAEPQDGLRSRRRFLREMAVASAALIAAGCSPGRKKSSAPRPVPTTTSTPAYFPSGPVFGDRFDVGRLDNIQASIASTHAPHYIPEARAYVSAFPRNLAGAARADYPPETVPLLASGIVVLYQRCTHLGCRVPFCTSSQWFECPCHDAKFDRVGEARAGPAPRGMDLMKASIQGGRLVIDTGTIFPGVRIGTNTTHQGPAGPACV